MSDRLIWLVIWLAFAGAIAGGVLVALRVEKVGVGYFDQEVVVESDKPICGVSYCCWDVDDATRQRAESTADPRLFDCRDATAVTENRFSARIRFTSRSRLFCEERVDHPRQIVVYVEHADGTRACRVADLPSDLGKGTLAVRLR
jgi:hypothetical protein